MQEYVSLLKLKRGVASACMTACIVGVCLCAVVCTNVLLHLAPLKVSATMTIPSPAAASWRAPAERCKSMLHAWGSSSGSQLSTHRTTH
jgi:hypothetical protein